MVIGRYSCSAFPGHGEGGDMRGGCLGAATPGLPSGPRGRPREPSTGAAVETTLLIRSEGGPAANSPLASKVRLSPPVVEACPQSPASLPHQHGRPRVIQVCIVHPIAGVRPSTVVSTSLDGLLRYVEG